MEIIKQLETGGERPLFGVHDLVLDGVTIHAGESALKKTSDITAVNCTFEGKYPFWHSRAFVLDHCRFTVGARAALWYSQGCTMRDCVVEAPKMFRKMSGISVENTNFPDGEEMLWDCDGVTLRNVAIDNCDYLFMHTDNIDIDHYRQNGNYTFQYCRNVVIRNAVINSKDAFWNTENVTVYDSEINGEYLGWYSKNLTMVNCRISGTQPFCYISGLKLVGCTMAEDSDLAFEESDVDAEILSRITSVKNPHRGTIRASQVGELILDHNLIADSQFTLATKC